MTDLTTTAALERLQQRIADRACISDIETEGIAERDRHGRRWYDTRPMLDAREHCDEMIDMAHEALDYAIARGLVVRHAELPHLVRIVGRGKEAQSDEVEARNERYPNNENCAAGVGRRGERAGRLLG